MTAEGRLARGKENIKRGKFLDNKETLEYMEAEKTKAPKKITPAEASNAQPAK